jgi:hypothetical protein
MFINYFKFLYHFILFINFIFNHSIIIIYCKYYLYLYLISFISNVSANSLLSLNNLNSTIVENYVIIYFQIYYIYFVILITFSYSFIIMNLFENFEIMRISNFNYFFKNY